MSQRSGRLNLHEILCNILGSRHVYFQPPANVKIEYPCIVYSRNGMDTKSADNRNYTATRRYQVTYISVEPDSTVPDRIVETFDKCRYGSDYTTDNLYHSNFDIFY